MKIFIRYLLSLGFRIVFVITGISLYRSSLYRNSVPVYCNFGRAEKYNSLKNPHHCSKKNGDVVPGVVVWPVHMHSSVGGRFTGIVEPRYNDTRYNDVPGITMTI